MGRGSGGWGRTSIAQRLGDSGEQHGVERGGRIGNGGEFGAKTRHAGGKALLPPCAQGVGKLRRGQGMRPARPDRTVWRGLRELCGIIKDDDGGCRAGCQANDGIRWSGTARDDVQDDAIIARVGLVAMRVPAAGAQVQFDVARATYAVQQNDGVAEIRSDGATRATRKEDAGGASIAGGQIVTGDAASRPPRRECRLTAGTWRARFHAGVATGAGAPSFARRARVSFAAAAPRSL